MGLAIANGYAKLMGGNIKVESVYGKGSTFTITLDQIVIDSDTIEEEYKNKQAIHRASSISDLKITGMTALVTDDNIVNLRVAQSLLTKYGLAVDTATNGADAIELCKNKNYDLIFMDQMMPQMTGTEAMISIRALNSHYAAGGKGKIIVLTADAIKGTREQLLRAGFDEYLGKPINFPQLERLFLRYLPMENLIL